MTKLIFIQFPGTKCKRKKKYCIDIKQWISKDGKGWLVPPIYIRQSDLKFFVLKHEDQDLPSLCCVCVYTYMPHTKICLFTPNSVTILMIWKPNLLTIDQIYLWAVEFATEESTYIKLPGLVNFLCCQVKIGLATHGRAWYKQWVKLSLEKSTETN